MASDKPKTGNKICSTPDCGKKITARGFCVACYYRNLRHGNVESGSPTEKFRHRLTNISNDKKTADCSTCGSVKIFHRGNGQYRCAVDANHRSKLYKRAYRASRNSVMKKYCEICGTKNKLCYDHSHKTGEYRGTLCKRCNSAIGLFYDNVEFLQSAISYLIRFNYSSIHREI